MQVTLQEKSISGTILDEIELQIADERCTLAELIQMKVWEQARQYNERRAQESQGYSNPIENALNSASHQKRIENRRLADPEKEVYRAWEAFRQNQYFAFVDGRQVESLDQEILLNSQTEVSFMQLTPLVGG